MRMSTKNYYDILGVAKSATEAEIKKAYKKLAIQYHPDRNKGDKKSESKFKEINEAYQTLSDSVKKKNYDQFWSSDGNPFGWMGWGWNPFWWWKYTSSQAQGFDFGDIFSQFWWWNQSSRGEDFDIDSLFGWFWRSSGQQKKQKEAHEEKEAHTEPNRDVIETIEIPFLDFLYDTSVNVRTIYGKNLSLKVKAGTKPGTKFKITGKWRTLEGKTGDMYVIIDAKMPREISDNLKPMLDALRYQL